MKKTKKRVLSALLALTMLIGLVPTVVFAAGESVTMTATYNSASDLETVTAVDENTITVTVKVEKEATAGYTLAIDLPYGVDLVSSDDFIAPGVKSITSTGTLATNDTFASTYETMFSGAPADALSWTVKEQLKNATTGDTIASNSGTLTYTLSNSSAAEFTFNVAVNSLFAPFDTTDEADTIDFGNITATLTKGDDTTTNLLPIKAETQKAVVSINITDEAREYASDDLNKTAALYTLATGNSNKVRLSMAMAINTPFVDVSTSQVANYPYFTLTVPTGSKVTAGSSTKVADEVTKGDPYDTWKIIINSNKASVKDGVVNVADFAVVELPTAAADLKAGDSYTFTLSDPVFPQRNVYNAKEQKFEPVNYSSIDSKATSISVIDYAPDYNLALNTYTQRNTVKNNYYTSAGATTYAEYWENVEAETEDITLLSFYRYFIDDNDTTTTEKGSTDPVKLSLVAQKVTNSAENDTEAYLDFVSKINFPIPFLANDLPRESVELESLTIKTEAYDKTLPYPYTDTSKGTGGIITYTFTGDEITEFMAKITGDEDDIGSYSAGGGLDVGGTDGDRSGIVEYCWQNEKTPMFIVTAPENESIISIEAEFSGDTNSFSQNDSAYGYKAFGYPKSPLITYDTATETTNHGDVSKYTYTIAQENASEEYAQVLTNTTGFLWTAPVAFNLSISDTTPSSLLYMYNATKDNVVANPTNTASKGLTGYQNLGSISMYNPDGAAPTQPITATAVIDTDHGDVVKEIYFPFSAASTVTALSYTLVGDSTEYTDISQCTYSDTEYGILTAPEGQAFASFAVTLQGWTTGKTTSDGSIFELRGYLETTDELTDATKVEADGHKLSIKTESTDVDYEGVAVDTTFKTNTATYAAVRVMDTVSTPVESGGNPVSTNILRPGADTDVEVMLFGGKYDSNPYNSGWHDIVFTIVLPDTITVNSVSIGDYKLEHKEKVESEIIYEETNGDISEDNMTATEHALTNAGDYFTEETGTVTNATAYHYKLTDEDAILFWSRYGTGSYDTHTTATVTMNLTAAENAETVAIPWSDVLIIGTDCEGVTDGNFDVITAGKGSTYQGTKVANSTDEALTTGVNSHVIVGPSTTYLYVDQTPMVTVQNAHIEKNNVSYDDTKPAIFTNGESGILRFTVLDTLADGTDGTNYVLMPLPTTADTSLLQTEAGFTVTPTGVTIKKD